MQVVCMNAAVLISGIYTGAIDRMEDSVAESCSTLTLIGLSENYCIKLMN